MEWLVTGRMSSESSDLALLAAARSGDQAAFSSWMERRRHLAFSYACAALGNRDEAEDVVQEAFVRTVQAYQRGGRPGNWEAWLMRVLRNLCTDALRRRRRRPTGQMDEQWSDVSPTPEMRLVAAEAEQELARAVAALPDSLRLPLVMHFGSCLTYREVALALGVRESTVIGRVASALRVLRRRFGAEGSR